MRIKALRHLEVPGRKSFEQGEEYEVSNQFGTMLIKRGHAEEVKEEKEKPAKKKAKAKESTK